MTLEIRVLGTVAKQLKSILGVSPSFLTHTHTFQYTPVVLETAHIFDSTPIVHYLGVLPSSYSVSYLISFKYPSVNA